MLSRLAHEALPYVCITAGLEVVFVIQSPVAWVLGAVLYAIGAYIWIRRNRQPIGQSDQKMAGTGMAEQDGQTGNGIWSAHEWHLPEAVYEAAPFAYIFAGVLCMLIFRHFDGEQSLPLTLAASVMFFIAGFVSWILRSLKREGRWPRRFC